MSERLPQLADQRRRGAGRGACQLSIFRKSEVKGHICKTEVESDAGFRKEGAPEDQTFDSSLGGASSITELTC